MTFKSDIFRTQTTPNSSDEKTNKKYNWRDLTHNKKAYFSAI